MEITPANNVPTGLKRELVNRAAGDATVPGLLVSLHAFPTQTIPWQTLGLARQNASGKLTPSCMLVPPEQMPNIFKHERELDLLKTIAGEAAAQFSIHGKAAVNGIWLLYGVAKLSYLWSRPQRETGAWVCELLKTGVDAVNLAGDVSGSLQLPHHWANGIDILVQSGTALYSGKLLSPIEQQAMLNPDLQLMAKFWETFNANIVEKAEAQTLKLTPVPMKG